MTLSEGNHTWTLEVYDELGRVGINSTWVTHYTQENTSNAIWIISIASTVLVGVIVLILKKKKY